MAKRIERQDLIDIDGYKEGILEAQQVYKAFAEQSIQLAAQLKKATDNTVAELLHLRSVASSSNTSDRQIGEMIERTKLLSVQLKDQRAAHDALIQTEQRHGQTMAAFQSRQETLITQLETLQGNERKVSAQRKSIMAELAQLAIQTDKLSKSNRDNAESTKRVVGQYNTLQKELSDARASFKALDNSISTNTGKINQNNAEAVRLGEIIKRNDALLRKADESLGIHSKNIGNYPKAVNNLNGAFNTTIALAGQLGVALSLADAITGIVSVRAEFEKLDKQLDVTLGSEGAGDAAQNRILDFANKTPRTIEEVTKAFNRLVDIGIVPTEKQLYQISDVAAAKSKTLIDYVEAIADAQTGEFERLKEFGINASKQGDKVTFTFKNQATQVQFTASAINDYLIGLGKVAGVSGQTEESAKTLSGRWAVLKDTFASVGNDIGILIQPAIEGLLNVTQKASSGLSGYLRDLQAASKENGVFKTFLKSIYDPAGFGADATDAIIDQNEREMRKQGMATRRLNRKRRAEGKQEFLVDDPLQQQQMILQEQAQANDKARKALAAAEKAKEDAKKLKQEADRVLREALAANKANEQKSLSELDTRKVGMQDIDYLNERLAIVQNAALKEQDILRKAGKANSAEYTTAQAKINDAASEYIQKRSDLEEKAFKDAHTKIKDAISDDRSVVKQNLKQRLSDISSAYEEQKGVIERAVIARQITEEKGQEQLHNLRLAANEQTLTAILAANDTEVQFVKNRTEQLRAQGKTETQIAEAVKLEKESLDKLEQERLDALAEGDVERAKEKESKITDILRAAQAKRDEVISKAGEVAIAAVSGLSDVYNAFSKRDIDRLEKQKEYELSLVGDNAEARINIEKRIAAQQAAVRRKQAIADKAAALFQIAINTAVNAVKIGIRDPVSFGLTIALGLLQAAAINAKAIPGEEVPGYFRGKPEGDNYEGPAWVAEQGYELVESKQGGKPTFRLAAEKQLTYLNRHDRVYTHQETKRMLATNAQLAHEVRSAPGGSLYQPPTVLGGASKSEMLEIMRQVFSEMTWERTSIDENGIRRFTEKQNNRTEWLNKRMSLPRRGR